MMTWCAAATDAERFVTARTFYVRVHHPKRQRPGKHFSGFSEAVQRLPLTVWWAVEAAVRRQIFRLSADRLIVDGWTAFGCDGTRLQCPRTQQREDDLGQAGKRDSAPMLWITALVSLRTGVLWAWRLGTAKASERQHRLDLLEDLPRAALATVLLVCDAGDVSYELRTWPGAGEVRRRHRDRYRREAGGLVHLPRGGRPVRPAPHGGRESVDWSPRARQSARVRPGRLLTVQWERTPSSSPRCGPWFVRGAASEVAPCPSCSA